MTLLVRTGLVSLACAATQAFAAPAAAPPPAPAGQSLSLTALKLLEPGLWELRIHGRPPKFSCIADTAALVQIEHDQPGCSRFVIANEPKVSTVHYSCERAGWGRTTVRVETPTTAAIQTQGISHNLPFDYNVEAHRVGACGAVTAAQQR